jgi:hypothetical protein
MIEYLIFRLISSLIILSILLCCSNFSKSLEYLLLSLYYDSSFISNPMLGDVIILFLADCFDSITNIEYVYSFTFIVCFKVIQQPNLFLSCFQ